MQPVLRAEGWVLERRGEVCTTQRHSTKPLSQRGPGRDGTRGESSPARRRVIDGQFMSLVQECVYQAEPGVLLRELPGIYQVMPLRGPYKMKLRRNKQQPPQPPLPPRQQLPNPVSLLPPLPPLCPLLILY